MPPTEISVVLTVNPGSLRDEVNFLAAPETRC